MTHSFREADRLELEIRNVGGDANLIHAMVREFKEWDDEQETASSFDVAGDLSHRTIAAQLQTLGDEWGLMEISPLILLDPDHEIKAEVGRLFPVSSARWPLRHTNNLDVCKFLESRVLHCACYASVCSPAHFSHWCELSPFPCNR